MRGTLKLPHMEPKTLWGSSPRMRGTPTNNNTSFIVAGIIPAYAGNTCEERRRCGQDRDHPRVCGEHYAVFRAILRLAGSSPRMRGTHTDWLEACLSLGIIPAYAGNTYYVTLPRLIVWDHPRVCGEHGELVHVGQPVAGSSPRMRGTLFRTRNGRRTHGIIPAYAGNTWVCHTSSLHVGDHPRVCGEHQ